MRTKKLPGEGNIREGRCSASRMPDKAKREEISMQETHDR